MAKNKIYKQFMQELSDLADFGDVQQLAKEYIYSGLTDSELLEILIKNKDCYQLPVFNEELLKNEAVLIQTVKVLGLLEVSFSKQDFITLVDKLRKKQNATRTSIDFDQVLKNLLKVKPNP